MKSILYPLVATALITITPFLFSFEKGQDIIRGLFCYSIFFLLLLFAYVKDYVKVAKKITLVLVAIALVFVAILDLENLSLCKGSLPVWYWTIPVVTVALSIAITYKIKGLKLKTISFVMFVSLGVQLIMYNIRPDQPLFEFPIANTLPRLVAWKPPRDQLPENFKIRYNVTDSVKVTRQYLDTTRSNVVILVESWGIPTDTNKFNSELAIFGKNVTNYGVHFRMYSRTRTAEREDLLDSAWRDSTRHRDSLFIPNRLAKVGFKNTFLFGGDSLIQHRNKYIRRIGFAEALFTQEDASDSVMCAKLDNLLADTTQRQLVAWTTRDTRFPMGENGSIGEAASVEKMYFERLNTTLKHIAALAQKYPQVRFIVQGDHEPIVAPDAFMEKFYRRWVPFVVLN